MSNFFFAGGTTGSAGGAAGATGSGLRSEGVLSGKGLRGVVPGRGVRGVPPGRGLRTFEGVGPAAEVGGADSAGLEEPGTAVIVPLERVDEGLGVMDDLSPGDGRDEGDELFIEEDLVRWYDAGFGGKLSIVVTLSLSTRSLTIFRGRSSWLSKRSGAGLLGGFIVPSVILGVTGLGVGGAAGFAAIIDACVEAVLENESFTTGCVDLGGAGAGVARALKGFVRNTSVFLKWRIPWESQKC